MSNDLIDEDDFDPTPPPRTKLGVTLLVVLLHIVVIAGLIRAFTPDIAAKVVDRVLATFSVTVVTPPPPPPPPPSRSEKEAGDEGNAGKKAVPKAEKAPETKLPISKKPAPKASSTGSANTSGATNQGDGTGAQGKGDGTGAGGSGNGTGGGAVTKPVHISGNITNAADFPLPPGGREARIGKSVILKLTVSPQGRATGCSVYRSSGFPDTDAVACKLAMRNLRFKPATNGAGQPVTGTFYWQQKFFF